MEKPDTRVKHVVAAAIMLGALAVGLLPLWFLFTGARWPFMLQPTSRFLAYRSFFIPPLVSLTLASTAVALLPPHRSLRRLMRGPGFVGCLAASLVLVLVVLPSGIAAKYAPQFLQMENDYKTTRAPGSREVRLTLFYLIRSSHLFESVGPIASGAIFGLYASRRWRWSGLLDGFQLVLCFLWLVVGSWWIPNVINAFTTMPSWWSEWPRL